jgi:hypothetical protein
MLVHFAFASTLMTAREVLVDAGIRKSVSSVLADMCQIQTPMSDLQVVTYNSR